MTLFNALLFDGPFTLTEGLSMARKSKARRGRTRTTRENAASAPSWTPSRYALWSQRWGDPNDLNQNYPTTVLLRHPTAPFEASVSDIRDDTQMQKIAYRYLVQANGLRNIDLPLGIPGEWIAALNPGPRPRTDVFPEPKWLPIKWPVKPTQQEKDEYPGSLVSFEVQRSDAADSTVIMLASPVTQDESYGYGFGVRVIAHAEKTGATYKIRITGLTATVPFGFFHASKRWSKELTDEVRSRAFLDSLVDEQIPSIAQTLGVPEDSVAIQGVRLGATDSGKVRLEWRGTSKTTGSRTSQTPFAFIVSGTRDGVESVLSRVELVADANATGPGTAAIFTCDPASQGGAAGFHERSPARPDAALNKFRVQRKVIRGKAADLIFPEGSAAPLEEVFLCPGFVIRDREEKQKIRNPKRRIPKPVRLPGTQKDQPPIRSNTFAAVSAYENFKQLFERFEAYGLDPENYFRITKLPLQVFYRSGIRPGPGKNGETINARVLVEGWTVNFEGPTKNKERPGMEVHLALGDLSRRERAVWNGEQRSPAEPLGIAADARWIWHEIGHILLMTSVGELQFRFCHSIGDALAAITADPQSDLAADPNWRGATYPWVFIPRRHDRCVSCGWGWGGTMHHAAAQVPATEAPRRKGYWTEQILSSSVFRLYQCLGGDTAVVGTPLRLDKAAREAASHYCVYLVMRALQTLGSSLVVPAHQPDQLVSALIDADVGTGQWNVTFPPHQRGKRAPGALTMHKVGGCVHKVIRWVFEAQGMYTLAGRIADTPGLPPPVDIYIENGRSAANSKNGGVQYGPGSYYPVSLDWDRRQSVSSERPAWQATSEAIERRGNNIYVTVGNRGTEDATDVGVRVWLHKWRAGDPPSWNDGSWSKHTLKQRKTIRAGKTETFGPFAVGSQSGRTIILAEATCGDDRANIDSATGLPCSRERTPLIDVVAGDNNLGLRVIGNP